MLNIKSIFADCLFLFWRWTWIFSAIQTQWFSFRTEKKVERFGQKLIFFLHFRSLLIQREMQKKNTAQKQSPVVFRTFSFHSFATLLTKFHFDEMRNRCGYCACGRWICDDMEPQNNKNKSHSIGNSLFTLFVLVPFLLFSQKWTFIFFFCYFVFDFWFSLSRE